MQRVSYFLLLSSCGGRRNSDVCSSAGNIWLTRCTESATAKMTFSKPARLLVPFVLLHPFPWLHAADMSSLVFSLKIFLACKTRTLFLPWADELPKSLPALPIIFSLQTIAVSCFMQKWCRTAAASFFPLKVFLPSGLDLLFSILDSEQYKQTVMCNNQPQFSCMWWKTLVLQTGLWTSVLMLEIKIFLNWEKALILIFTFNIKEMLPELIISDALLSYECPWCLRVFYQGHRLFFFCCISTGFSTHFILLLLLHLYFSKFRGSHPAKKIKMKQTGRLLFSEHLLGKLEALYRGLMLLILFFIFISFVISIPCKGVTYWRLLRKGYC